VAGKLVDFIQKTGNVGGHGSISRDEGSFESGSPLKG
jgi:hypothetical protein